MSACNGLTVAPHLCRRRGTAAQAGGDGRHLGLRFLQVHPGFQVGHYNVVVFAAHHALFIGPGQGRPQLRVIGNPEVAGHHPGHQEILAVQIDAAPNNFRTGSEVVAPEAVA